MPEDPVSEFGQKGCAYIMAGGLLIAFALVVGRILWALAGWLW